MKRLPRSRIPFPPTRPHRDRSRYNRRDLPDFDVEVEVARLDRQEARCLRAAQDAREAGDMDAAEVLELQADRCRQKARALLSEDPGGRG